jgi:hypothetical protein
MVLPMPGWTAFTRDADASAWCAKYCDEATTVYTIAGGVEATVAIAAGRWALAPGDVPDDGVFASVAEIADADLRAGYTAVAAAPTITLLDGEIVTDQHGTPLRRRDSVAHHADLVEVHTPYISSTTAPTSTSLGYPLQVGMVWRDTSGGIGVLRSCTAVDGGGVGTWGMDGPAVVKLPLADADTAGGVLAWANPEGADILVTGLIVRETVSTADAGFSTGVVFGTAPDATTFSDNYGGINTDNGGAPLMRTLPAVRLLSAGQYLTGSADVGSPSVAGLAGFVYIAYHLA